MRLSLTILFLFSLDFLFGQNSNVVNLSSQNISKIENAKTVKEKLELYRKFYRRDSIKEAKANEKYWKHQSDSILLRAEQSRKNFELGIKGPEEVLAKSNHTADSVASSLLNNPLLDSLNIKIPGHILPNLPTVESKTILNQETQLSDKLNKIDVPVTSDLTSIGLPENLSVISDKYPELVDDLKKHSDEFSKYSQYPDSLKSILRDGEWESVLEEQALTRLDRIKEFGELKTRIAEAEQLKGLPGGYKDQMEQLQDSAYIKEQAKRKAEELALKYIGEHPQALNGILAKVNGLMSKYSIVPNSNDLSSAKKSTSLKGKKFSERLVIAANLQVLNVDPFTIDLAPAIGFKINSQLALGFGFTYRQTFGDSISNLAPDVLGYKSYASYDILNNFFLYTEFAQNSPGIKIIENESTRIWKGALLLGIGKRFNVFKKVDMTTVFTYNFLHKPGDPIYPRPWTIRVGFQTSELAMLKRRPVK